MSPTALLVLTTLASEQDARALVTALVADRLRSEEHTSELQSLAYLVCRLLLEKKKNTRCILCAKTPKRVQTLFYGAYGLVLDHALLSRAQLRPLRLQIDTITQDPTTSLSTHMTRC